MSLIVGLVVVAFARSELSYRPATKDAEAAAETIVEKQRAIEEEKPVEQEMKPSQIRRLLEFLRAGR